MGGGEQHGTPEGRRNGAARRCRAARKDASGGLSRERQGGDESAAQGKARRAARHAQRREMGLKVRGVHMGYTTGDPLRILRTCTSLSLLPNFGEL